MKIKKSQFKQILQEECQKLLLELETTDLSVLDWTKGMKKSDGPRDSEGRLFPRSWTTGPHAHPNWVYTTTPGGPITGRHPRNWPEGLYCQGEECWWKVPELPTELKTASEMTEEERALLDRLDIPYEKR
jgi:hypothetical protein